MQISQIKNPFEGFVHAPTWALALAAASLVCLAMYGMNLWLADIDPGNWWGLTYGIAAALLMLGAGLYGVRRRMLNINAGNSREWVRFHIYGGTLASLLVLMHTGFRLPDDFFNGCLWFLAMWTTLSGFLGIALQRWIPRMLSSGLSVEVLYERIPELTMQLRRQAEQIVMGCSDQVKDFYRSSVSATLAMPQPRLIYYVDVTGGIQARVRQFEYLRRVLSSSERESLDALQNVFRTKLELDAHYSLQRALRWWLYTHVPLSLVLLVMVALHVWAVWYY